jgi:hypothetical protein
MVSRCGNERIGAHFSVTSITIRLIADSSLLRTLGSCAVLIIVRRMASLSGFVPRKPSRMCSSMLDYEFSEFNHGNSVCSMYLARLLETIDSAAAIRRAIDSGVSEIGIA